MYTVGWAVALPVALIIRIGVCDIREWYLVFYVYAGVL